MGKSTSSTKFLEMENQETSTQVSSTEYKQVYPTPQSKTYYVAGGRREFVSDQPSLHSYLIL